MQYRFTEQRDDTLYRGEGGPETEIMYKLGYEFPHFAMFVLLDNPDAVADIRGMFSRYLDRE